MVEDILIRMGVDARPVSAALRGVRQDFAKFKSDLKNADPFAIFKGTLGTLGIAASAAGLVALGKSAINFAGQIKDLSDATNTSASTLQAWSAAVSESGGSAEDANKVIGKLAEMAKEHGRTTDAELANLMDRIQSAKSPLDQLTIATDAFGDKLGVKVVNALKQGSANFEEFKKSISGSILTDAEVNRLDEIGDRMGQLGSRIKAWAGKGISFLSTPFMGDAGTDEMVARIRAKMAGGGGAKQLTPEQMKEIAAAAEKLFKAERDLNMQGRSERGKLAILQREQATLAEEANKHEKGTVKYLEAQTKLLEKQKEVADQIEKVNKREADFLEEKKRKQKEIADQREREEDAINRINEAAGARASGQRSFESALSDQTKFTLQDLASTQIDRWTTRGMAQQIMGARQVAWLQNQARWLAGHGYEEQAQTVLSRADKLRSGLTALTENERYPWATMIDGVVKQEQHLAELLAKAKGDGINVVPVMGN